MCELSVVIPAYQEGATIRKTVEIVANYLKRQSRSWEILVVNDGSRDATAAEAAAAARAIGEPHARVLHHPRNLGKGAAVRTGVLASRGQSVAFYDADGATPIDEMQKFLPRVREGADLVVGSRRIPGAEVRHHQPWPRQLCGRIYTWLVNGLIAPGISDVTCGFKVMRGSVARQLFSAMQVAGWSFDAELFFLARRLGYRIVEVPVTWTDQPNTKVRMLRAMVSSFWELLRIRWRTAILADLHRRTD